MKKLLFLLAVLFAGPLHGQTFAWVAGLNGPDADSGVDIITDAAGNVYTSGVFRGTVDFDPSSGTSFLTSNGDADVFLQKMDAAGNLLWVLQFGGIEGDGGGSLHLDPAGNIYLSGYFRNTVDFDPNAGVTNLTSAGVADMFIIKLDAATNLLWARRMGGANFDSGSQIDTDASGNVLVTGAFRGTVDFDPSAATFNLTSNGPGDVFVWKLDASGNLVWARHLGGTSSLDRGVGLGTDAAGNVYTSGTFNGTVDFDPSPATVNLTALGATDIFVQKLDPNGNLIWARNVTSTPTSATLTNGLEVDAAGNVYTVGNFQGTGDFDPSAAVFNLTSAGGLDMYVHKMDANGNLVWARRTGGPSSEEVLAMTLDASANVYLSGSFAGTVDFDPSGGTFNLTEVAGNDVFIQKLDNNGNFQWATAFGNTGYDGVEGITVDISDNVYSTGFYVGTVDFDPGPGVLNLTASGPYDAFVHKLSQGAPLQGEAAMFTASSRGDGQVALQWSGLADAHLAHFELERAGAAGNWQTLNSIAVDPASHLYTEWDTDPLAGANHYRLRMVGLNGAVNYSETATVVLAATGPQIAVFPNPAQHLVSVTGATPDQLKLYNALGQVLPLRIASRSGSTLQLDIAALPSGIYWLKTPTAEKKLYKQ